MKKPKIEIKSEYAEGIYNGVFINGNLICLCVGNKESDAVRLMIDALLHVLDNADSLELDLDTVRIILNALKKAGHTC